MKRIIATAVPSLLVLFAALVTSAEANVVWPALYAETRVNTLAGTVAAVLVVTLTVLWFSLSNFFAKNEWVILEEKRSNEPVAA